MLCFCSRASTSSDYFSCSSWSGDTIIGSMANGLCSPQDDAQERLSELAEILAVGLLRLRLKQALQSSGLSADAGESPLDCLAHRSVHANRKTRGLAA